MLVEDLRDALDLELLDVGLDPALGEDLDGSLERMDLRDVDRGEAAAEDDRAVVELVLRVGHVAAFGVVESDHEGVLVDEALPNVFVGSVDGNGPVAPGAVREDHRGEAPVLHQLLEVDVATDLRVRHEGRAFLLELLVDDAVFLVPQRHVPARETVFDLPVRPRVLFEHEDLHALVGETARHLGTSGRAADDCHEMSGSIDLIGCHGEDVRSLPLGRQSQAASAGDAVHSHARACSSVVRAIGS